MPVPCGTDNEDPCPSREPTGLHECKVRKKILIFQIKHLIYLEVRKKISKFAYRNKTKKT